MRKLTNNELHRLSIADYKTADKLPLLLVLDNVRSAHNVGAAFRTADAFCIQGIWLCGITAQPPNKEIAKTALGATDTVVWRHIPHTLDALALLRQEGYTLVGIEQTDSSLPLPQFSIEPDKQYALVFGHEVSGVAEDALRMCDYCLEIPQFGAKHSLNVSVSVGVVLWDMVKKIKQW